MVSSQRKKMSSGNVRKRRGEGGWFAEGIQKKGKEVVEMCFFKIMIGDFASKLYIPPAIAEHINMHKFANATLNSHTGSPWRVKLYKRNNAVFINNGWRTFVACHSLQFGDFLMFSYNGYLNFDVKIFDRSGCERAPAYLHKNVRIDEKESEELYNPHEDPSHGLCILEGTQSQIVNHQEVPCHSDNLVAMGTYCYTSKRKPVTQKERDRALRDAASLKLSRPHFLSKMVRTSVYKIFVLNIPRSFLREVDLRHSAAVALRGPSGMKWAAKVSRRPCDHRGEIRHGWGPFSVAHNLEEGDVCVFELTEHVNPIIDVHIFRVVEEITPLQCKAYKRRSRAGKLKKIDV